MARRWRKYVEGGKTGDDRDARKVGVPHQSMNTEAVGAITVEDAETSVQGNCTRKHWELEYAESVGAMDGREPT